MQTTTRKGLPLPQITDAGTASFTVGPSGRTITTTGIVRDEVRALSTLLDGFTEFNQDENISGRWDFSSAFITDKGSGQIFTNRTGVVRASGDVVMIDTANDQSFVLPNVASVSSGRIGVVAEAIGIGAAGRVAFNGFIRVNAPGATRGQYLQTQANSTVAVGTTYAVVGSFAIAITNPDVNGFVLACLHVGSNLEGGGTIYGAVNITAGGVNLTGADQKVSIAHNTEGADILTIQRTDGTNQISLAASAFGKDLIFKVGGVEKIRFGTTGVGIGTSTVSQKSLQVHNPTVGNGQLAVTGNAAGIELWGTTTDRNASNYLGGIGLTTAAGNFFGSTQPGDVVVGTYHPAGAAPIAGRLMLITDSTPRLTIDGSGHVGIGTLTPEVQLDLGFNTGAAKASIYISNQGGGVNAFGIGLGTGIVNNDLCMFAPQNHSFSFRQNGPLGTPMLSMEANTGAMAIGGVPIRGGVGHAGYLFFPAGSGERIVLQTDDASNGYGLGIASTNETCLYTRTNATIGFRSDNVSGGRGMMFQPSTGNATFNGVLTQSASWRSLKTNIKPMGKREQVRALDWLIDDFTPVRYRFKAEDSSTEKTNLHLGFIMDDMPEDIRDIMTNDQDGGIVSRDVEGLLMVAIKELGKRVRELENTH